MIQTDFTEQKLREALSALGEEALAAQKTIDIAIYGGSALILASNFRISTKDVDAVFEDDGFVAEAADRVGQRLGLPQDWLNDGVRTYLAPEDSKARELFGSFPSEERPGLRVFVPTPEYLLAMKLMALRIDPSSGAKDLDDILNLMMIAGLADKNAVLRLAAQFYPEARISGKLHLAIDGVWREKLERERSDTSRPTWFSRRGREDG